MTTRRYFLRSAAVASVAVRLPLWFHQTSARSTAPGWPRGVDPSAGPDDPALRALALRAVEAARAAGATYADVRLTADRTQTVSTTGTAPFGTVRDVGAVYVGVRALVDGYWGFASAPECTAETMVRLAQEAAAQAKVNQWGTTPAVTLDGAPPSMTGTWRTPVMRDPFQVSAAEKTDFLHDLLSAPEVLGLANVTITLQLQFRRQEKVFASTAGAFLTQTLSWVGPSDYSLVVTNPRTWERAPLTLPLVPLQSGGYEVVAALRPHDLAGLVQEAWQLKDMTSVVVGRYDLVLDAHTTAALVRSTIGYATELDRVHGDEVNTVGTSYLTPAMLGTPIASRHVTVVGSRSVPHGPAAVAWDDDGVVPDRFTLVKDGVLMDFATDRARAPSLNTWYHHAGRSSTSHGCATADTAADLPMIQSPDLILQPAAQERSFEQLVAETGEGIAVLRGDCELDQEQGAGQGFGALFEIHKGQLGRYLGPTASFLFRSGELWKKVDALGGPSSAALRGFTSTKGEPTQQALHGVFAVPMRVRQLAVIDALRM